MADSPDQTRHPSPTRRNASSNNARPPSYSYSAQTNNERNRIPSDTQHESQDYQRFLSGGMRSADYTGSVRSMDSRFSLNEQFAASRRDYEFDLESDTESILEPPPIITESTIDEIAEPSTREQPDSEDDGMSEVSEAEILRLLDADDDELDYYSILSLPRDPPPSSAQIRSAYHRLSLGFHPDKQPQSLKAAAERHFSRIQKAYETLIDPQKRVIYDLEGEEGVQEEYKMGGIMGKGGEKDMLEVGVKTLSPAEFKVWFMNILKNREQRAVESLVGGSGYIKVQLDGRRAFMEEIFHDVKDAETGKVVARVPASKIEVVGLEIAHDFLVPLTGIGKIYRHSVLAVKDLMGQDTDVPVEELQENNWEAAAYENSPTLSISAGIQGRAINQRQAHYIEDEPEPIIVNQPLLLSQEFTVGAGVHHKFPTAETTDSKTASWLSDSQISCSTTFFPRQTYRLGLSRSFTLLENTRPFFINVEANQEHNLNPPQISAVITRAVSKNSSVFCQLHSGPYLWPAWLSTILDRLFNLDDIAVIHNSPSSVQLGWLYAAAGMTQAAELESQTVPESHHPSNETWKVILSAWTTTMNVSVSYGRDLFARSQTPPVRSRIMNSGEALPTQKPKRKTLASGIRLEVEAGVDIDMSASWTVTGLKQIGDFTSVGLGVGVNYSNLNFSLSWQRLGQKIKIPVIILPPELLNGRAVFWSLAFPWGLYSAYEFLLLRPAGRKARKRLIKQKRRELRAIVARKREEALQAMELMAPMVAYKQTMESENDGLVILEARYGTPASSTYRTGMGEFVSGEVVDVTIPLAGLVDGGQLVISKKVDRNGILGFYDPVPLGRKGLGVRYLFGGKEHAVYVSDKEGLVLPQREHEVHT